MLDCECFGAGSTSNLSVCLQCLLKSIKEIWFKCMNEQRKNLRSSFNFQEGQKSLIALGVLLRRMLSRTHKQSQSGTLALPLTNYVFWGKSRGILKINIEFLSVKHLALCLMYTWELTISIIKFFLIFLVQYFPFVAWEWLPLWIRKTQKFLLDPL